MTLLPVPLGIAWAEAVEARRERACDYRDLCFDIEEAREYAEDTNGYMRCDLSAEFPDPRERAAFLVAMVRAAQTHFDAWLSEAKADARENDAEMAYLMRREA